jgi:hypothetical protein
VTHLPAELVTFRAAHMAELVPETFHAPLAMLKDRFGACLDAVLLYGSCRRAQDAGDGVVDLYAIVRDYTGAYRERWLRWANALLPPNVFYAETPHAAGRVRVKYAVLSRADLERGVLGDVHPYLWARFCQPVALLFVRDEAVARDLAGVLSAAVLRFLAETLPIMQYTTFSAEDIWTAGFRMTYRAELRPEGEDRAGMLVRHEAAYYRRTLELAAASLTPLQPAGAGLWRADIPAGAARRGRITWLARRGIGVPLSVARLSKSALTFTGGVDYAAWKVERHTGVHIDVTPRLRRHPLLFGWRVLWQLLRRGALR